MHYTMAHILLEHLTMPTESQGQSLPCHCKRLIYFYIHVFFIILFMLYVYAACL